MERLTTAGEPRSGLRGGVITFEISPHFTRDQFTAPLSLEDRVLIFADRVRGWQLDVAERLGADPHAGFAVLAIVGSYFELIAKYSEGYVRADASKHHFKLGARLVLEPQSTMPGELPDSILDLLYDEVRCGMYHGGMTGPRIRLQGGSEVQLLTIDGDHVTIDPAQLVRALQDHFSRYVKQLSDPNNQLLRDNFRSRFDAGVRGKFN